jgi:DNA-binding beta-propeller fold protein YncE
MRSAFGCAAAVLALALASGAQAQLVVSANDGKQLRPGEAPATRTPDTIAVIDLGGGSPRVLATLAAPASMIGPPSSVAVAPDESFAIVSASQALDAASPPALVPDDTVSVVDLQNPAAPRIVQTVHAGPGASGLSINKAGTLALVAATGDDTVTVFSIAGKRLTEVGKVKLDDKSRPTDVAISPDGKSALVVTQTAARLVGLTIDGTRVSRSGAVATPGAGPYGVVYNKTGDIAFVSNLQGRPQAPGAAAPAGPRLSAVTAIDLKTNTVAGGVEVGATSEHLMLSPDGNYLAVTVVNGSNSNPTSRGYNTFGLLKVYRVQGPTLTQVAEARTGQWGQGGTWSRDGRLLLQQNGVGKAIEVFRFDGATLVRDDAATLKFDARPGAVAGAWSR